MPFTDFFQTATGNSPYGWQMRLANQTDCQSHLIDIPTGLGKTAGVVLAWLWNYLGKPSEISNSKSEIASSPAAAFPRRLVYCLPMRTLVEQTVGEIETWLKALAEKYPNNADLQWLFKHSPITLMGGEELDGNRKDWHLHPERPAILVGTQDMLLSRALNRGYAASRARWPIDFAFLNNDCLWVMDEIQLMGAGLATTCQLEAFRNSMNPEKACFSWFASATLDPSWLKTVDLQAEWSNTLSLDDTDKKSPGVSKLLTASKPIQNAQNSAEEPAKLANEILQKATEAESFTLVVCNTVKRARSLHAEIKKLLSPAQKKKSKKGDSQPEPSATLPLILLHSQFRPDDRAKIMEQIYGLKGKKSIVVSTQVVEAGVDISAQTLFTETAPWSSLVQRFGRCNRRGESTSSNIFHIPLSSKKTEEKQTAPYSPAEIEKSLDRLKTLKDASLEKLADQTYRVTAADKPAIPHVLRRKDLIELFDTTPDLSGQDIDIERFIREADRCHLQVYWREWQGSEKVQTPPDDFPAPARAELCSAPIGEVKDFVAKNGAFLWDFTSEKWKKLSGKESSASLYPGQVLLIPAHLGGYSTEEGWGGETSTGVAPVTSASPQNDSNHADPFSECPWQNIAEHTKMVCSEMDKILASLPVRKSDILKIAALWHDWGKAHSAFQAKLDPTKRASELGSAPAAKAPKNAWVKSIDRPGFRHELASALAMLVPKTPLGISDQDRDLAAYLVAAHHGKVRLSIRSFPDEQKPASATRFARGVWDADILPATPLSDAITAPETTISLEPMELGECEQPPFTGLPSWCDRMLHLRDRLGIFRLAYLEMLLRAADCRASQINPPTAQP